MSRRNKKVFKLFLKTGKELAVYAKLAVYDDSVHMCLSFVCLFDV